MATALLTRFSYPKVPGDQPESILDLSGPTSYTPLATGTPPTGGQQVYAADFGLQSLDFVWAMGSNDGQYFGVVVPYTVTPLPGPPLPTQLPDGSFDSVLVAWMQIAGGQASGDLSASTLRLFARGH